MIISLRHRYIFVHVPKTGGTALAEALEAKVGPDDILIGDTPKAKRRKRRLEGLKASGRLWKHSKIRDIEGAVSAEFLSTCRVFTIVRNPWDRMVSYYHWLKAQRFEHPAVTTAKSTDFEGFLWDPAVQASIRANPTAAYTTGTDGTDLCSRVLRTECLGADAAELQTELGLKLPPVEKVNVSERTRDYRGYYTPETQDIVARICAEDIARFHFQF